jgi:cation:H+ antiporter
MDILISLGAIILGLVLLTLGGNLLVDGAVSVAKKWWVSEAIIGLTIVAIGTSVPELIVSLLAALSGSTEIAIGNVLWSNIANVFLILWVTAVIAPVALSRTTRFFDLPIVILSTVLLALLVSDVFFDNASKNIIGRIDGIILFSAACMYILYSLRHNNTLPDQADDDAVESDLPLWKAFSYLTIGIGVLFVWGKILVDGAVDLAKMAGLSESIIGLTIVAVGTSAPEMVTSVLAARRGKTDIAIGNVVGSNVMNILVILGISAFIAPLPFLSTSYIDLLMALFAPIVLLILALFWTRNKLERRDGILLMTIYVLYVTYLIVKELR